MVTASPYGEADLLFSAQFGSGSEFTMKIGATLALSEVSLTDTVRDVQVAANLVLVGGLALLNDVLAGKQSPLVERIIFGDCPSQLGAEFHRRLPKEIWQIPRFYRTDNTSLGRIAEIQCPGSMWGECDALQSIANNTSNGIYGIRLAEAVAGDIQECTGTQPLVLHLMDNASAPLGVRYFIGRTRPRCRYFGIDRGLASHECNFIRSHSVYGLFAENLFATRLHKAIRGELWFDLPPLLIFDQKSLLGFPFMEETRNYFPDIVRRVANFTTIVTGDRLTLEDGCMTDIDAFAKRPPRERPYYLKYAGTDTNLNWGSRGVYRLSNDTSTKCLERLQAASSDATRGRFWLLQRADHEQRSASWFERDGSVQTDNLHMGYRHFFSPKGTIATMYLGRHHFKVHGQDDTVAGLVAPSP